MKKTYFLVAIFVIVIMAVFFFLKNRVSDNASSGQVMQTLSQEYQRSASSDDQNISASQGNSSQNAGQEAASGFVAPISRASERVTKKPFGIFITPGSSPVSPERFRGYHTGADFEIFPEELNQEVSISAVCDGILKVKEYATGYGGVAVEECDLNGSPITVVYGHLKLASIAANVGEKMKAGENIGILGAAYSTETDGERKHLHLGFHRGTAISILGYVQNESALSGWIDPCLYVCK